MIRSRTRTCPSGDAGAHRRRERRRRPASTHPGAARRLRRRMRRAGGPEDLGCRRHAATAAARSSLSWRSRGCRLASRSPRATHPLIRARSRPSDAPSAARRRVGQADVICATDAANACRLVRATSRFAVRRDRSCRRLGSSQVSSPGHEPRRVELELGGDRLALGADHAASPVRVVVRMVSSTSIYRDPAVLPWHTPH